MIKGETVKDILDINEADLEKLETEKLRDLLGVLHYSARLVEHELNKREQTI